jgi:adenine nucleotide transporter 17
VSNPVIQFFCYEQFKQARLLKHHHHHPVGTTTTQQLQHLQQHLSSSSSSNTNSKLSPMEAFCLGALAKGIATITTYPLQLTQTLLRLKQDTDDDHDGSGAGGGGGYHGLLDCLRQLYTRGGIPEWFTGMRAKLLQTVLTAAFTFLTYEQILGAVQAALIAAEK